MIAWDIAGSLDWNTPCRIKHSYPQKGVGSKFSSNCLIPRLYMLLWMVVVPSPLQIRTPTPWICLGSVQYKHKGYSVTATKRNNRLLFPQFITIPSFALEPASCKVSHSKVPTLPATLQASGTIASPQKDISASNYVSPVNLFSFKKVKRKLSLHHPPPNSESHISIRPRFSWSSWSSSSSFCHTNHAALLGLPGRLGI